MSVPASAFTPTRPALQRPHHSSYVDHGRDRPAAIGISLAMAGILAGLLLVGVGVTHAAKIATPITIDLVKENRQPEIKQAQLPKISIPMLMTAPPPVIDIAPSPNAMVAVPPPKAAQPPAPPAPPAPEPTTAQIGDGHAAYIASLLAYLERFKQYPSAARQAHIEGAVLVHFLMNRDGKVLSAEIYQSSGRQVLDHEALAMIARAGQLPPIPADMKGDVLDAVIGPINFKLR